MNAKIQFWSSIRPSLLPPMQKIFPFMCRCKLSSHYLSISLSIYLSSYLPTYLYPWAYLPVYIYLCLSIYLSISPSVCLSLSLSLSPSQIYICLNTSLSTYLCKLYSASMSKQARNSSHVAGGSKRRWTLGCSPGTTQPSSVRLAEAVPPFAGQVCAQQ